MPRALTGPNMQGRLLDVLNREPGKVYTYEQLCKTLHINSTGDLHALADKTRSECQRLGSPQPYTVLGVGYKIGPGVQW